MTEDSVLGFCYEFGLCGAQNKEKAIYWYNRAAEGGHAKSQYRLGVCYLLKSNRTDIQMAVACWRKAADQGYVIAQFSLGVCYAYGIYGIEVNEYEAKEWLLKAAEQGHDVSQLILDEYDDWGSYHPAIDDIARFAQWYPPKPPSRGVYHKYSMYIKI